MNPTFITARLLVRPRQISDLEQCLLMDQDPRVMRYIRGPWANPNEHRTFVINRITATYPRGLGYWSVFDKCDSQHCLLGWVLLLPYPLFENEVEIGWRFNHARWGRGYATESAAAVLEHAFKTVKLQKVVADINPLNLPSIAVAAKLGMKYVEDREVDSEISKSYQITGPSYLRIP